MNHLKTKTQLLHSRSFIQERAEELLESFLPYFTNQKEGSINPNITIELSERLKKKMGLALLFEQKIRLNYKYFRCDEQLLAYTLFHEMTHLWLYNCGLDPGHTQRFYDKMQDFHLTHYVVDTDVHVHTRITTEAKYIYQCTGCHNRWHLREKLRHQIYCGLCFKKSGLEYYAQLVKSEDQFEENFWSLQQQTLPQKNVA